MRDTRWEVGTTGDTEIFCNCNLSIGDVRDYALGDDNALESEPPVPTDDEQARKLKVARFAHVPVDCLEIKIKTKEAG